ncbi:MAG: hypothetical protein FJ241_04040 [Nitrospira sp.]|nr:hypothetical protein [Nitrospira sp.]
MKDIDKKLIDILANKPDLIIDFPEWMLPASTINTIRDTENVAIAEIAGRDSVASVIRASEMRPIKAIVPTIAYTGTEYGNWQVPFEKIDILKDGLHRNNIHVFDPVVLGSPRFWWTLCGRYVAHFFKAYGFYSHCVGCHLYFHAIRIPLAKKLNCNLVIGGERESHNGKIKINQIGIALDAYADFLKRFGIELSLPLRYMNSGKEIEEIIGQQWDEGKQQLECVLSRNYQEMDGSVSLYEKALKQFFEEFAFEASEEAIKNYLIKL